MYKIKIPTFDKVIAIVIAILIVYLTGTIQVSIEGRESFLKFLSIVLILMGIIPIIEVILKRKWNKLLVVSVGILGIYWIFNCLHYADSKYNLLIRFLWIFTFLMCNIWFREYMNISIEKYIYQIVVALSVIAIVFWILLYIVKFNIPYTLLQHGNIVYFNYYNLFYVSPVYEIKIFGLNTYRIQSIFWEPGMYGVLLTYALYYYITCEKKKNIFSLIILVISVVLTFSTTGIMVTICLLGYYCINGKKIKKIKKLIAIPVISFVVYGVINVWLSKKAIANYTMMSYSLRMSDFVLGFELFLKNIFVGIGYNNLQVFKEFQGLGRGNSNGFITLCYSMGIVGVFLFIYPFLKNLKVHVGKEKTRQIIYIVFFIIINMTEPIYTTPLILWMVSSQYILIAKKGGLDNK